MYRNMWPFLKITYHKKEYKCIHNRFTPINEIVCMYVVNFFHPNYLDRSSISMNFPKNDSIPAFEGIVNFKKCKRYCLFLECKRNKAGPAALQWVKPVRKFNIFFRVPWSTLGMTEMMKLNGKGALGVSVDLGEGDITEGEDGFANISQVRDDNCML